MDMETSAPPPELVCRIDGVRRGLSLEIRGQVRGEGAASGDYSFDILKISASGQSRVTQRGAFRLNADAPAGAGLATLDFAPGARIVAHLRATSGGRSFECSFDESAS